MAIRKAVEETVHVGGDRAIWIDRCEKALLAQKFKAVRVDRTLGQVRGDFKQVIGTLWGDIVLTVASEGRNTRIDICATANVDNIYALGRSPGRKLIEKFKEGLGAVEAPFDPEPVLSEPAPPDVSVSQEIARLAALRDSGVLDEAEFKAAKAKLLS